MSKDKTKNKKGKNMKKSNQTGKKDLEKTFKNLHPRPHATRHLFSGSTGTLKRIIHASEEIARIIDQHMMLTDELSAEKGCLLNLQTDNPRLAELKNSVIVNQEISVFAEENALMLQECAELLLSIQQRETPTPGNAEPQLGECGGASFRTNNPTPREL